MTWIRFNFKLLQVDGNIKQCKIKRNDEKMFSDPQPQEEFGNTRLLNDLFLVIYLFQNDQTHALDTENLGNGTVVTFLIIPPVILLSYVLDGRYEIQRTFLEWVSHKIIIQGQN